MIGKSILHAARHALGIDDGDTQTSPAERECLEKLADGKKRIVEIGVYEGVTTRLLGNAMSSEGELYAVDPFIPGRLGICWGRFIAYREAKKSKGWSHMHFVEDYSHEASKSIKGDFDLVFIDGDHSLVGITQDWADWSPRITKGGHIALHDTRIPEYNKNIEQLGSYQYFESHIKYDKRFDVVDQVDSLSVLQRK